MAFKSLTTTVRPDFHAAYVASLPPGESVNSHLKQLVAAWLDRTVEQRDIAAQVRGVEPVALNPVVSPAWTTTNPGEFDGAYFEAGGLGDPGCVHPMAYQYREGRTVRCRVCGKVLSLG